MAAIITATTVAPEEVVVADGLLVSEVRVVVGVVGGSNNCNTNNSNKYQKKGDRTTVSGTNSSDSIPISSSSTNIGSGCNFKNQIIRNTYFDSRKLR